jgi:hypothetical protein
MRNFQQALPRVFDGVEVEQQGEQSAQNGHTRDDDVAAPVGRVIGLSIGFLAHDAELPLFGSVFEKEGFQSLPAIVVEELVVKPFNGGRQCCHVSLHCQHPVFKPFQPIDVLLNESRCVLGHLILCLAPCRV